MRRGWWAGAALAMMVFLAGGALAGRSGQTVRAELDEPATATAGVAEAPTAQATERVEAAPLVITLRNNRFDPDFEVVTVGSTVEWRNAEPRNRRNSDHNVYAEDGSFGSPVFGPGGSWSFTFTAEGYYRYFCDLHEGMEGALLVVPAEGGS